MPKLLSKEELDKISFEYAGSIAVHDLIYTLENCRKCTESLCENEDDCRKLLIDNGVTDYSDSYGKVMIIELIQKLLEERNDLKMKLEATLGYKVS